MKNLLLLILVCSMLSFTNISAFADKTIGYGYFATCQDSNSSKSVSPNTFQILITN